jgi:hypothetical protein
MRVGLHMTGGDFCWAVFDRKVGGNSCMMVRLHELFLTEKSVEIAA